MRKKNTSDEQRTTEQSNDELKTRSNVRQSLVRNSVLVWPFNNPLLFKQTQRDLFCEGVHLGGSVLWQTNSGESIYRESNRSVGGWHFFVYNIIKKIM